MNKEAYKKAYLSKLARVTKIASIKKILSDPLTQHVAGGTLLGLGAGTIHLTQGKERRTKLKKALILGLYGVMGARTGLEIDMLRRVDALEAWDPRLQHALTKLVPERMKIK